MLCVFGVLLYELCVRCALCVFLWGGSLCVCLLCVCACVCLVICEVRFVCSVLCRVCCAV